MMKLAPHRNYNIFGTRWLGKVPEHWSVQRLRNVAHMRVSNVDKHIKDDETPVRLCNYVDVYKNTHISEQMKFMRGTATHEEIERFRLEENDVLITKDSEAWDDIGVPALVTTPAPDLISGYHLALLRPAVGKVIGGFLLYAIQSKHLAYQFHVEAKGVTRYGLSHASIKSIWLPVPPLPEQKAIVRYLNYFDRRIRRYMAAKQKLIGLLEEQKQVIIHRAVTRGLDPDVPLKDSGVEWLGKVPEHWNVRRLKHICSRSGLYGANISATYYQHSGVRFLRTTDITDDGQLKKGGVFLPEELVCEHMLSDGDILISRSGTIGRSFCYQSKSHGSCSYAGYLVRFILTSNALPKYIFFFTKTQAFERFLRVMAIASTIENVNADKYSNAHFFLPPLPEQTAIVKYLDKAIAAIDIAITRARREIELLHEYRTRLTADVVTGKLDVREAAAGLPDEPDAPESFNEADSPANALDIPLEGVRV